MTKSCSLYQKHEKTIGIIRDGGGGGGMIHNDRKQSFNYTYVIEL